MDVCYQDVIGKPDVAIRDIIAAAAWEQELFSTKLPAGLLGIPLRLLVPRLVFLLSGDFVPPDTCSNPENQLPGRRLQWPFSPLLVFRWQDGVYLLLAMGSSIMASLVIWTGLGVLGCLATSLFGNVHRSENEAHGYSNRTTGLPMGIVSFLIDLTHCSIGRI